MVDKRLGTLLLDHITPIVWNKLAFERLVLDPEVKELITALVSVHISAKHSADLVEGKGQGLIVLLHGGPGTGKTLTAESVAELAEKPLYRVTCGDIGTDAEGVEQYLESVLYIGKIWGCVVLLDEADVFLEERSLADLQRNALVSVFLRILEYYEGILILTSNRVGTFDEAFKSRIKLALHYKALAKADRRKVWRNFIKALKDDSTPGGQEGIDYDDLDDHLDDLATHNLNGRQIRNAVATATELAQFRKQKLDFRHFQHVIRISGEFDTYLEKTHGHSDTQWARDQGTRY
jgi:AAA+ superfamily predicted ATPase